MSGTDVAADVPNKFDVVIDGYGYVTARQADPNMPFRVQQQQLNYTPTFLERTNVSGSYGDDSQAFFLTESQDDWSHGEQQRFFRQDTPEARGSFWDSQNIDVTTAGQLSLRPALISVAASTIFNGFGILQNSPLQTGYALMASASSVFQYDRDGTATSLGSCSLSTTISTAPTTICTDGTNIYASADAVLGAPRVRKFTSGTTWSTFSATGASRLSFHNNSLYGVRSLTATDLLLYDTAGNATVVGVWKNVDGTYRSVTWHDMCSFGGSLLMLMTPRGEGKAGSEIWLYDGVAVKLIAQLPPNFQAVQMCVVEGVVYIGGALYRRTSRRGVIFYYANGQLGVLWRANGYSTNTYGQGVGAFEGGVVFFDEYTNTFKLYEPAEGEIHSIASWTPIAGEGDRHIFSCGDFFMANARDSGGTTRPIYPATTTATSGYITSSLFDFDNSLTKLFRGIKVDFSAATDGNGGSVDIAYQVDSLDGSFTTLQASAVSGTEYALSGVSGHSISVKITLNKGTSTNGPILKRLYVRGVPILQSYRTNQFILDLTGTASGTGFFSVRRRDNSDHNLTGEQMRANLAASIQSTAPLSITDITGTYSGVLEPGNCEFDMVRPKEWYARIQIREI